MGQGSSWGWDASLAVWPLHLGVYFLESSSILNLDPKANIRSGNLAELVQRETWLWNTSTKPVVMMWVSSPRSDWYVCAVRVGGRKQVGPWSSLTSQPNCLHETQDLWGNLSQKLRWSTFEDNAWSWPCIPHAHMLRAYTQAHEHTPMNKCTCKLTSAFHMHTQQIRMHRHTNTHTHTHTWINAYAHTHAQNKTV